VVLLGSFVLTLPAEGAKSLIFELEDPRGDDHGDGRFVYPGRTEFEKGDLDLVRFKARRVGGETEFEAVFARPIRVPGGEAIDDLGTQLPTVARYGFYTFNIDIYIDIDRQPGSGAVSTMPGRKAVIESDSAWDRAVILTPKPHEARGELKRLVVRTMAEELREIDSEQTWSEEELKAQVPQDLSEKVYFPSKIRVRGNSIRFSVPDAFFGGPAQADWSYVIAVSGCNLLQSLDLAAKAGLADEITKNLMVLPVSPGTWMGRFGGGRDNEELQPPLVDIIVPKDGRSQESLLGDFSSRDERPAKLPGVVPETQPGN
jgi:hypothetical protein